MIRRVLAGLARLAVFARDPRMRPLVRALSVSLLVALAGLDVVASDCVRVPLRTLRQSMDLLFTGTVVRVEHYPGGRIVVDLDVEGVWKGRVTRRTTIYTWPGVPGGVRFEQGRRYAVAAPAYARLPFTDPSRESRETLDSPGCGWAQRAEDVAADLAGLGRPRPPRG